MTLFQAKIINFFNVTRKIAKALAIILAPFLISFSLKPNNDNLFFDWLFDHKFLIFILDVSFTIYFVILKFVLDRFQPVEHGLVKFIEGSYVIFVSKDQFDEELEFITSKISNEAKQFFEYAEELVESAQYSEAIVYYKKSNNIVTTLSASLNLSNCYLILGEYENANNLLINSINQFKDINVSDLYAYLLLNQSVVYIKLYKYKLAIETSINAKRAFHKINDEFGQSFALGNEAIALFRSGLSEKALKLNKKNLRLHKKWNLNEFLAKDHHNIANIYCSRGEYAKAEKSFKKALDYINDFDNEELKAEIFVSLGALYFEIDKQQLAKDILVKALEIWQTISNPNMICTTLCVLSRNEKNRQKAINYIREAQDYAEIVSNNSLRSLVLRTEGELYLQDKRYDKALKAFGEALDLIKNTENERVKAYLNRKIGEIFFSKQNGKKAIEHFKKALNSDELLNDNLSKTKDLLSLGDTYKNLDNKEEAYKYYTKANVTSIQAKTVLFEIVSLLKLAKLELSMSVKGEWLTSENFDRNAAQKAIQYYNKIIKIAKKNNSKAKILAYNLKGEILRLLGNEQLAFRMHKKAKNLAVKTKDNKSLAEAFLNMGSIMACKDNDAALSHYKEALKIATTINDKFIIQGSLTSLISLYNDIGDKESANIYEEKLKNLSKNLTNEDKKSFKYQLTFPG